MNIEFTSLCYKFNQIAGKHKLTSLHDFKSQLKLIQEEVKELEEALDKQDIVKTLDGGVDILVTTIGLMQKLEYMGIDVFGACIATAENNLTKFPHKPDDPDGVNIKKTLEMYQEQGKEVQQTFGGRYGDYIVYKDNNDKVMKPYQYVSNDLTKFCIEPNGAVMKIEQANLLTGE